MSSFKKFQERLKIVKLEKEEKIKKHIGNIRISYIYFIQNKTNKKIYIGRSIYGVEERFKQHCLTAIKENSDVYNNPLSKSIRKYGKDNFNIGYLDCELVIFGDHIKANNLEQTYIKEYGTLYPKGYNISGLKGNKLKNWRENGRS